MIEKEYQAAMGRYRFGYLSPEVHMKSKKYCTHAIHQKPDTPKSITLTLVAIILISTIILVFGCVEQFIVFFGALVFSLFLFKIKHD
jgi:hypothetical protein